MVKKKLKRILICEDDIVLTRNFEKKFAVGIKELNSSKYKNKWDLLYLGCGNLCGDKGISERKTGRNKHMSQLSQFMDYEYYVSNKDDLRIPCDDCKNISDNLSIADSPGGGWCYSYSLKGAKKLLKIIGNKVYNHIDQIIEKNVEDGNLLAVSFNPPIVMHEYGAIRNDSQIPWKW
jgi:GR25 family glycosyltransferase involved in LPS biosynthesis